MSKEFVPGKGLVPSRSSPVSAADSSIPYWSPASKIPDQVAESIQWGYDPADVPVEEEDDGYQDDIDWGITGSTLPAPPKRSLQTVGIPEPIRQHFRNLDIDTLKQMPPDDDRYKEIPSRYSCAFPLDDPTTQRRAGGSFGYASAVFRVTDNTDSNVYALRRFDNVRTTQTIVQNAISKWVTVRHPSIVSLYFIAADKGSVFFTHAFHPSARTLKQKFIDQRGAPLAEALLWRILTQLLLGIRAAHLHGLAVRAIGITRILLVSGTRIRINSIGVPDVLEFESRRALSELQADDILKLGIVMLSLATRTAVTNNQLRQAMELVQNQYSPPFHQMLEVLLSGKYNKISSVMSMVPVERWCDELDLSLAASDGLHSHLRSEYESSRIVRLLLKLGMINERPEKTIAGTRDWSETGDRYILKLFRDFLFHQSQLDGTVPSLDAGHIIASLNKLDIGDPEKILLSSKNNKDLLVVSFADVHRCLEEAFADLVSITEHARAAAVEARRAGNPYSTGGEMDHYGVPMEPSGAGRYGIHHGHMGGGGMGYSGPSRGYDQGIMMPQYGQPPRGYPPMGGQSGYPETGGRYQHQQAPQQPPRGSMYGGGYMTGGGGY